MTIHKLPFILIFHKISIKQYIAKYNIFFKPLPLPANQLLRTGHFSKRASQTVLADMSTASQNKLKALVSTIHMLLVSLGREGCEILDELPDSKNSFDDCSN